MPEWMYGYLDSEVYYFELVDIAKDDIVTRTQYPSNSDPSCRSVFMLSRPTQRDSYLTLYTIT
jgi:hypothetical protein